MFEGLAAAVEDLSVPVDGPALVEIMALRDRLDAKITESLVAFDRAELWDTDAATSLTAWLRDRAGLTSRQAQRQTTVVRRLADLPVTTAAWQAGVLSGGQVDAIVGVLGPGTGPVFADHETGLVPTLAGLSTTDTVTAMRVWAAHATADGRAPVEPDGQVWLSRLVAGHWAISGDLDPEGGAIVARALGLAESADVDGDPLRRPARRRADALVDVARFFLDWQTTRRGGRHRPHLNVIVETDLTGQIIDGPDLDRPTVERLLCDAVLHRVLRAGSAILDNGLGARTPPAPLWHAVVIRDRHCRFPSCDRRPEWCQAHHVTWFSRGGPTTLDNLTLVRARHHHRLHQPGWHAKLKPDGTLEVTNPDGVVRTSHPPGTLHGP